MNVSRSIAPKLNVLVVGATGRLGALATRSLKDAGHRVHEIRRGAGGSYSSDLVHYVLDPAGMKAAQWRELMEKNEISVVLNLAAQSSGDRKMMAKVNTQMPQEMAMACKESNRQMIHTCTYCSQLEKASMEKTAYAATKREAALALEQNDHVVSLRIDAVTGAESSVPVFSDAAVSTRSPFVIVPPIGGDKLIHPVDEKTVIAAITKTVEYVGDAANKDRPLPKVIDIAGEAVTLEDFLKMVNPSALMAIKIPEIVLQTLATLVDKGVFTKEFLNIMKLMNDPKESPPAPDTSAMQNLLGVKEPKAHEVARAAQSQLDFVKTNKMILEATGSFVSQAMKPEAFQKFMGKWPLNFAANCARIEKAFKTQIEL